MRRAHACDGGREWTQRDAISTGFPEIDGDSQAVRSLKREMACVARDPEVTVLLNGESGTGKERVARAIHDASPRRAAPFVVVDCGALPPTLAEDALFGHVRGAFTGAAEDRAGPFERADGGTILLDEIGDLPLDLQTRLLRALQSRTILRLGSARETAFDLRIIAATHVDLEKAVVSGRFREDLYFRLKVYEIRVPSLRERGRSDIETLVQGTLERLARRRRVRSPEIDRAALELLAAYDWPGNIRELENTVLRMLVASGGSGRLGLAHLPPAFGRRRGAAAASPGQLTREGVCDALLRNQFSAGRTAAELGISRHQLYRLVKRHAIGRGVNAPPDRPTA